MKFMFIFRGGEEVPEEEMPEIMAKWGAWIQGLGDAYKDGAPLGGEARVLTSSDGSPGMETIGEEDTEVSGYVIAEAADLDSAVDMCRECPVFETKGQVEIREAIQMDM